MKRSELRKLILEELSNTSEGGYFSGEFMGGDHASVSLNNDEMRALFNAGVNLENLDKKNLSPEHKQLLSDAGVAGYESQELSGPIEVSDVMTLVKADRDPESDYKMSDNFYSFTRRDQLSDEEKKIISI